MEASCARSSHPRTSDSHSVDDEINGMTTLDQKRRDAIEQSTIRLARAFGISGRVDYDNHGGAVYVPAKGEPSLTERLNDAYFLRNPLEMDK